MDPGYFDKPENGVEDVEKVRGLGYLNLNDTIIKPLSFKMLEKFNGSSEESAYLLTYRKKPKPQKIEGAKELENLEKNQPESEEVFPVSIFNGSCAELKSNIQKSNPILLQILEQNNKVRNERIAHESYKSKIRIFFAFGEFADEHKKEFDSINDKIILDPDQFFKARNLVSKESLFLHVLNTKNLDNLESVISQLMSIEVEQYVILEVKVQYGNVLHFRHVVDLELVAQQYKGQVDSDECQIRHNSLLLFLKKDAIPQKFELFLGDFDDSEPVQMKFSYKGAEMDIFCQRAWSIERVNQYFETEIKGRVLQSQSNDSKEDGEQLVRVPCESFDVKNVYVSVNSHLVNLQTMALSRSVDDLVFHNQEVCYIERNATEGGGGFDENLVEVIFEKSCDIRTREFDKSKRLSEALQVSATSNP